MFLPFLLVRRTLLLTIEQQQPHSRCAAGVVLGEYDQNTDRFVESIGDSDAHDGRCRRRLEYDGWRSKAKKGWSAEPRWTRWIAVASLRRTVQAATESGVGILKSALSMSKSMHSLSAGEKRLLKIAGNHFQPH